MTPPTDQLSRVLRGAADDIVERAHLPGPDTPDLWARGRRGTWAARAAGAGLVAVAFALLHPITMILSAPPYWEFLDPRVMFARAAMLIAVIAGIPGRRGNGSRTSWPPGLVPRSQCWCR